MWKPGGSVIVEFAGRRFIMVLKHLKELASFWRIDDYSDRFGVSRLPAGLRGKIAT
jgi:hypothetical protein